MIFKQCYPPPNEQFRRGGPVMLAEKQAILERIAAFDHVARPDVQRLARQAFEKRLESIVLAWMLTLQQPGADPMHVQQEHINMRCSTDYFETDYTKTMQRLNFCLVPEELAEDVKASGTERELQQQVDDAVGRIAHALLRQRVAALGDEILGGRRALVSVNVDRHVGVWLNIRLWTEAPAEEAKCACCSEVCWL